MSLFIAYIFYSAVVFFAAINNAQEIYHCSVGFCKNRIENGDCPEMPKIEDDQKLHVLPPSECNCCDYYLEKIAEGKTCSLGDPSGSVPNKICGDGLYCNPNPENDGEGICKKLAATKCTKEQEAWDKKVVAGTVGNLEERPTCDRNGDYSPRWCIRGQTCYCRNKEGERIFGTFPYSSSVERDVLCECARKVDAARKLLGNQDLHPQIIRCTSNGNYDTIQCLDDKTCYCTDEKTGKITDEDWFGKPVPMEKIGKDSLWCFNEKTHTEGKFYRSCQEKYETLRTEVEQLKENGIEYLGSKSYPCQADGLSNLIQTTKANKFCMDPFTENQLENFSVQKSSSLATSMNCKCALARHILRQNGFDDLPDCCENGNYAQVQCRMNECRCVDENGNQIVKEVYKSQIKKLKCYKKNEKLCT